MLGSKEKRGTGKASVGLYVEHESKKKEKKKRKANKKRPPKEKKPMSWKHGEKTLCETLCGLAENEEMPRAQLVYCAVQAVVDYRERGPTRIQDALSMLLTTFESKLYAEFGDLTVNEKFYFPNADDIGASAVKIDPISVNGETKNAIDAAANKYWLVGDTDKVMPFDVSKRKIQDAAN